LIIGIGLSIGILHAEAARRQENWIVQLDILRKLLRDKVMEFTDDPGNNPGGATV
jgi:hypothetical protein